MRHQELNKFFIRINDRCQASVLGVLDAVLYVMMIDPGETILCDRGLSYVTTDVINHITFRDKGTHVNIPFPAAFHFQNILQFVTA